MKENRFPRLKKPELLAPAGDWECAKAAVENGADAVYFGLDRFNARMRASNFTEKDLPALMENLHSRSVRGYLTFNTLVFTDELEAAADYLETIIRAGVDAAIVQDIGIVRMIRSISPDFPIHASTQMTLTSAAGLRFARALGCDLAVMARECSLAEIEKIRDELNPDWTSETSEKARFPLEIFVHGALCVAYSGQCLTSEALGGRSANRGECAQACRMPYELMSDGTKLPLGDRRYLLSPQDLAGVECVPEMILAGIHSFKIEGRLKSPEYVANITRVYRNAIDEVFEKLSKSGGSKEVAVQEARKTANEIQRSRSYPMEMAFSRGLHTGWLKGIDNQALVHARFGKKRGVKIGIVEGVGRDKIHIRLENPIKPGDGVVFDAGNPDKPEEGGRIRFVDEHKPLSILGFLPGKINWDRVSPGNIVWKTSDPALDKSLRRTFEGESIGYQRPLDLLVWGTENTPLQIRMTDDAGTSIEVQSLVPLRLAVNKPLDTELLRGKLGRLGNTPFYLRNLENRLHGNLILPVSELNRMRREGTDRFLSAMRSSRSWRIHPAGERKQIDLNRETKPNRTGPSRLELIPLVRNLNQLRSVLDLGSECVYCDFENPKTYREAVQIARGGSQASNTRKTEIFLAPPRIFKPGEEWILKLIRSAEPDGYLIRNYDHLEFFKQARCRADFSFNVANPWSAQHLIQGHHLERVTASYDLNASQLLDLLAGCPSDWIEITLHQHMPLFHMEHCVFCAFMSKGKDYRDCGRPCERHSVDLRDRVGLLHPLKADAGCRNTVFNARAQTGAEHLADFQKSGAQFFRIEFVNEKAEEVKSLMVSYLDLFHGRISGSDLWRKFRLQNQLGVTRGTMEKQTEPS